MASRSKLTDDKIARRNWARYQYGLTRGHSSFCKRAVMLERFYMGGGKQWDDDDRAVLEDEGRKPFELNEIADAINTALGNQIQNRVDIGFRPRGGGADDEMASTLSKVAMQIADNNDLRHTESTVTGDGFIQSRGYFDIRVEYSENLLGEIKILDLDPLDVIPDPDAKGYDPDTWRDVIVTRWLTLDEIEALWGRKARNKVAAQIDDEGGQEDFGESEIDGVRRSKFGHDNMVGGDFSTSTLEEDDEEQVMVRVIDRQHFVTKPCDVALYPTGDLRVMEGASPAKLEAAVQAGAMIFRRPMKRVRWTVSTYGDVLVHDDWSPYKHFTIVPYYPFFRRGQTKGLIDDAVSPQEMLNKAITQYIHIVNTMANGGWIVEEGSLSNMSTEDLEDVGAQTGLVIEFKATAKTKPEKIQPNQVPTGVDRLVDIGSQKIRTITGITDAIRGVAGGNQSGKAIQSLQFGSQLSLSVPLDNLARTRHLLADRMLALIQEFMDLPQLLRIIDRNVDGTEVTEELFLNWEQADGQVLNDVTIGEYDVVVSEQPSQVTFDNSQFEQGMLLKDKGAPIPWAYLIRRSSLADKTELIAEMQAEADAQRSITDEAKAALDNAKAGEARMKAVMNGIEAMFSAIRASQLIRADPALAGLADSIARSAGFEDQDQAPIVPDASGLPPAITQAPTGTNPMTPDNPQAGVTAGIEAGP